MRVVPFLAVLALFGSSVRATGAATTAISEVTAVRDRFVRQIFADGFTCPIRRPTLRFVRIASFGSYEPKTNSLTTPLWGQLSDDDRAIFHRIAGAGATAPTARREFETGAHHWILVHELGHWWQACNRARLTHYAEEFGANRIATAYWRSEDPALLAHMNRVFHTIVATTPRPVPAGRPVSTYFDSNYEKLGPTPQYIWFQAFMCVKAYDERPVPTLRRALHEAATYRPADSR